jgi:hypothetical protein
MKKGTIDKLCEAINQARRVTYPQRGYLYFANIKGDGISRRRRVYMITSDGGGVTAMHNGSYRQTAKNLREVLEVQNIY